MNRTRAALIVAVLFLAALPGTAQKVPPPTTDLEASSGVHRIEDFVLDSPLERSPALLNREHAVSSANWTISPDTTALMVRCREADGAWHLAEAWGSDPVEEDDDSWWRDWTRLPWAGLNRADDHSSLSYVDSVSLSQSGGTREVVVANFYMCGSEYMKLGSTYEFRVFTAYETPNGPRDPRWSPQSNRASTGAIGRPDAPTLTGQLIWNAGVAAVQLTWISPPEEGNWEIGSTGTTSSTSWLPRDSAENVISYRVLVKPKGGQWHIAWTASGSGMTIPPRHINGGPWLSYRYGENTYARALPVGSTWLNVYGTNSSPPFVTPGIWRFRVEARNEYGHARSNMVTLHVLTLSQWARRSGY